MKDEKEEIKPAPLGEGKKDYTDADVSFANSFQRDNKHYIKQDSAVYKRVPSPTSEPPEELTDKEFCEMVSSFSGEMIDHVGQLVMQRFTGEELKEFIQHCFTHRKRD